jgi:hypothetical protein
MLPQDSSNEGENTSELSYISLDCTSSFEQNGVQITSQGCPPDEDKDGYLDTEEYIVDATNSTDSIKYVEYNFREDSRGGGDRVYLQVDPNTTKSFSMSFGNIRKYGVDETDILKRDIIVRDDLKLGNVIESSTESFFCPDGKDVDDQSTSFTVEKFGWDVQYSCLYDFDFQAGYSFGGSRLRGNLESRGKRSMVYKITDENQNTVIYQEESDLGFVYPNEKEFEITLYITE